MRRAKEPSLAGGRGMQEVRATEAPSDPPAASSYRSGPAAVLLCSHHYSSRHLHALVWSPPKTGAAADRAGDAGRAREPNCSEL